VDTVRLVSTGMWVPSRVLTNAELETMVEEHLRSFEEQLEERLRNLEP